MKYESATAGEEKISDCEVHKVGAYSYQRIRNKKTKLPAKKCYRCDSPFSTKHIKHCKVLRAKCSNCQKIGHFAKVLSRERCKLCRQHRKTERCHSENNRNGDIPIKHLEHSTVKQSPEIYRCKKRFRKKTY